MFYILYIFISYLKRKGASPCRGIQDSLRSWIPRRGFRIPDSRYWISLFVSGTRILHSNLWRIPDSLSCIPDSTSKIFTESRFNNQKFRESGFLTCGKKDKPYLHLWETERTILPMLSLTPSAQGRIRTI